MGGGLLIWNTLEAWCWNPHNVVNLWKNDDPHQQSSDGASNHLVDRSICSHCIDLHQPVILNLTANTYILTSPLSQTSLPSLVWQWGLGKVWAPALCSSAPSVHALGTAAWRSRTGQTRSGTPSVQSPANSKHMVNMATCTGSTKNMTGTAYRVLTHIRERKKMSPENSRKFKEIPFF